MSASVFTNTLSDKDATQLVREGACIVCVDVPVGTDFGLDLASFQSGAAFLGFKMVPPGPHFMYFAGRSGGASPLVRSSDEAPGLGGQASNRQGVFLWTHPRGAQAFRWSTAEEDLDGDRSMPKELAHRWTSSARAGAIDRQLGAYPLRLLKRWRTLTKHISEQLLGSLTDNQEQQHQIDERLRRGRARDGRAAVLRSEREHTQLRARLEEAAAPTDGTRISGLSSQTNAESSHRHLSNASDSSTSDSKKQDLDEHKHLGEHKHGVPSPAEAAVRDRAVAEAIARKYGTIMSPRSYPGPMIVGEDEDRAVRGGHTSDRAGAYGGGASEANPAEGAVGEGVGMSGWGGEGNQHGLGTPIRGIPAPDRHDARVAQGTSPMADLLFPELAAGEGVTHSPAAAASAGGVLGGGRDLETRHRLGTPGRSKQADLDGKRYNDEDEDEDDEDDEDEAVVGGALPMENHDAAGPLRSSLVQASARGSSPSPDRGSPHCGADVSPFMSLEDYVQRKGHSNRRSHGHGHGHVHGKGLQEQGGYGTRGADSGESGDVDAPNSSFMVDSDRGNDEDTSASHAGAPGPRGIGRSTSGSAGSRNTSGPMRGAASSADHPMQRPDPYSSEDSSPEQVLARRRLREQARRIDSRDEPRAGVGPLVGTGASGAHTLRLRPLLGVGRGSLPTDVTAWGVDPSGTLRDWVRQHIETARARGDEATTRAESEVRMGASVGSIGAEAYADAGGRGALGEMQVSFVCSLLEHNRAAFQHWQRLVDVILRCDDAIIKAGSAGGSMCTLDGQPGDKWFLLAWQVLAEQLLELPEEVILGPFARAAAPRKDDGTSSDSRSKSGVGVGVEHSQGMVIGKGSGNAAGLALAGAVTVTQAGMEVAGSDHEGGSGAGEELEIEMLESDADDEDDDDDGGVGEDDDDDGADERGDRDGFGGEEDQEQDLSMDIDAVRRWREAHFLLRPLSDLMETVHGVGAVQEQGRGWGQGQSVGLGQVSGSGSGIGTVSGRLRRAATALMDLVRRRFGDVAVPETDALHAGARSSPLNRLSGSVPGVPRATRSSLEYARGDESGAKLLSDDADEDAPVAVQVDAFGRLLKKNTF